MIKQIHKSTSRNKALWTQLYDTAFIKEASNYRIFDSEVLMIAWAQSLNNIGHIVAMGIQQICSSYVESYPYTMMINDDTTT